VQESSPELPKSQPYDPNQLDLFRDFIAVQKEEIDLRRDQLQQRAEELKLHHELSLQALHTQSNDRKDDRKYRQTKWIGGLIFSLLVIGFLLAFACFAIVYEAKELVLEMTKILLGFAAGGLGGYAIGYQRAKSKSADGDYDISEE